VAYLEIGQGVDIKSGPSNGSHPAGSRGRASVGVMEVKPQTLSDLWNLN